MSFKIVQTIEKGKKLLSIVPTKWESQGTLYWPTTEYNTLRQNPLSTPVKRTWLKMKCVLKRQNITSLKEALKQEKQMTQLLTEDTEDHNEIHQHKIYDKKSFNNTSDAEVLCSIDQIAGLSNEVEAEHDNTERVKRRRKDTVAKLAVKDYNSILETPETTSNMPNNFTELEIGSNFNTETIVKIENNECCDGIDSINLDDRLKNVEKLLVEQGKNIEWIKEILSKMLVLQENLVASSGTITNSNEEIDINNENFEAIQNILKIDSEENLSNLEDQLNDSNFSKLFVNYVSQTSGRTGKKDAKKCRYIIFDSIFDRKFMTNCSWTGTSHNKLKKKVNFSSYTNIIDALFKIFKLADINFNRSDMKEMVCGILHNSTSRFNYEIAKRKLEEN